MSKTIDERVVEMRFDNQQFERNVQTSMSTLEKLKQSLKLSDASKGLQAVDSAAKNVDMSGLGNAVESVKARFSALQVMGVTALANITNSAVNAGKQMVSALTVEPIKAGFQEYETQMNAVQTILANTQKEGTNVKIVNKALDELNTYADKTIYNFTEMTRNIGTFTAAGVKLDTSVSSIKGIANLAAVSGSTSQQASTAMYQLSQAIASGTVKLQDWNSVVNAGMGGQVFQDALIRTAEHLGTGAKAAIKAEGSFRESLKDGWLTTEVLTKTLDQFATAADTQEEYEAAVKKFVKQGYSKEEAKQMADMAKTAGEAATKVKTFTQLIDTLKEALGSGWTTSWRLIIGDFEEAKSLWTEVSDYFSDVINKSSEARNKMLQGWADGGGRTMAIESIKNAFNGLLSIIKPIKEAFRDVFPPMTAKQLLIITERIRDLTAKFKLSKQQSENLKNTFKGLFSVVKIGVTVIKSIISGVATLVGKLFGFSGGILNVTGSLGEMVSKMATAITENNLFGKAIEKIVDFLGKGIDKVKAFFNAATDKIDVSGFDSFLDIIKKITEFCGKAGKKIAEFCRKASKKIAEFATVAGKAFGNAFRNGDIKSLLDIFNGGIFASILLGIKKFVKNVSDSFGDGNLLEGVKDILDGVKDSLEAYQKNLKADTLKKIAVAIAILAASIFVIAMIDPGRLAASLGAITVLFGELLGSLKLFEKIDKGSKGTAKAIMAMIGISVAVLILASALKKISGIGAEDMTNGLVGIFALIEMLILAAQQMDRESKAITKFAGQTILLSIAVGILSLVAKRLGSMSWDELAKAGSGILGIVAILVAAAKIMDSESKAITKFAGQMILMSVAVGVLSLVAKLLGSMSWEELAKAGSGILGIVATLVAAAKIMDGESQAITKFAGQMILMSVAVGLLAGIAKLLATMSWEELGKAGSGIAGCVILLVAAAKIMDSESQAITKFAGQMILMSIAIGIMTGIAKILGSMSWEELGKAGAGLLGITAILVGTAALMKEIDASGAGQMVLMAAAIVIIAGALKVLGGMSWENIAKGLVSIIVVLGAFVGVTYALAPVSEVLLVVAGSIALFGVACLAVGVGIMALATGLTMLAGMTTAAATAIVAAITIIIVGIIELIPAIVGALTDAVVALCEVIIRSVPAIGAAIKAVVLTLVDVLVECVPAIADGALKLVLGVLDALVTYAPQIVNRLFDFLISIINTLAQRLPELVQAGVNLLMSFFKGVVDSLNGVDPEILVKGILAVGFMSALMIALAAMALLAPAAMIGVLAFGAVITELSFVLAAVGALAQIPGLEWLISEGGDLLMKIGNAIGKFVGGIVGGIAEGITASLPKIADDLSDFMMNLRPFIDGANDIDPAAIEGVNSIVKMILALTASNILEGLASWLTGGSSLENFAKQIVPFGRAINEFASTVSGIDGKAVQNAANAGKTLAEMAKTLPNSGGVKDWFTGNNDMDKFGEMLVSFGESMSKFATSVSGIDSGAVKNAATAGKAMAEMAKALPNSGGMKDWFTGSNDMDKFGEKLVSFGESMSDFSKSISGINPAMVVAASMAGKALASMAKTLPNSGGIKSWFTGDIDMGKFGKQLAKFGKSMKSFSDSVSGMNPATVIFASIAGKALANMAKTMPNSGGIKSWFTGDIDMGKFGKQLIKFGISMRVFAESVSGMDSKAVTNAATAGKALAEMAKTLPASGGIKSWFTADNDMSTFGRELTKFGKSMKKFAESISGMDSKAVKNAATAGKTLAEMAKTLPNSGGIKSLFAADNDMSTFGRELTKFGKAMKSFDKSITGINTDAVTNAATAGKALAEMAKTLPETGGIKTWLSDSDMGTFGKQLVKFGEGMKSFAESITDINTEAVTNAATAGKTLIELAKTLPETGGIKTWLSDSDIGTFGKQLVKFGEGMKSFAESIEGINTDAVTNAATAGKALAEMAKTLPDSGGVKSLFAADNDMSTFGRELVKFGEAMKSFAESITGINTDAVTNAATAGKALAEMAKTLPESDSITGWFSNSDMSTFGTQLVPFGKSMKMFSDSIIGINTDAVTNAATAGKTLTEMAKTLPETDGIKTWLSSSDMSTFGAQLVPFGNSMKQFANSIEGINTDAVTNAATAGKALTEMAKTLPETDGIKTLLSSSDMSTFGVQLASFGNSMKQFATSIAGINTDAVTNAATAGKALTEMAKTIPETDFIKTWLSSSDMSTFGVQLVSFGRSMKQFADSITGMDPTAVINAANAGKTLSELGNALPNVSKISSSLNDSDSFGSKIVSFGRSMKQFADSIAGMDPNAVTNAANAGKALSEMGKALPNSGGLKSLFSGKADGSFGQQIVSFGQSMKRFSVEIAGINPADITNAVAAFTKVANFAKSLSGGNFGGLATLGASLGKIGKNSVDNFVKAFQNAAPKVAEAGKSLVTGISKGVSSSTPALNKMTAPIVQKMLTAFKAKKGEFGRIGKDLMTQFANGIKTGSAASANAFSSALSKSVSNAKGYWSSFYDAGAFVAKGFASGIDANAFRGEIAARAMAKAAYEAAKEALKINSPSKIFRSLAAAIPEGFAQGIYRNLGMVSDSATNMAETAINNTRGVISRIADVIQGGIDTQPTIRPVLDLSDVESGASTIGEMFNVNPSVGMMANIGSINSMMSRRQNGSNDDVITAINDLGRRISDSSGNTYNSIGNITYDDGSEVSDAIRTLVRAARIERRT